MNRRRTLAAIGTAAVTIFAPMPGKAAPSGRLNVAVVGIRGRGRSLISTFAGSAHCQITHLCDVNTEYFGAIG